MDGPREGPLILIFIVATLAASALVLHRAEADAVKDPNQKAARGEIKGLSDLSLVRPENLRKALAKIDASQYPLIVNLRVAPDRVNAMVRNADGIRRFVTVDPSYDLTSTDANTGEDYAVHGEGVNVNGPERMLKAVVAKTGLSPAAFDYVATTFSKDSPTEWFMSMKQGPARVREWVAAADGSDVRRPGEPSAGDKARQAANARALRHTQLMIKRRTNCINRAHDATAVTRCTERYQP